MIADTAQQKHAAAIARRHADTAAEKPSDVAIQSLAAVAASFSTDGYVSRANGRRLVSRNGDLSYEMHFQLDRNNISGKRVAVWPSAMVGSLKLRQWRAQHGTAWGSLPSYSSYFAGGHIGNLRQPPGWMEWDFADPTRRDITADDLIEAIREILVPFFASFRDPRSVLDAFDRAEMLSPVWAIEFAQAHFGRDGAEHVGRLVLDKQPQLLDRFLATVEVYRVEGLPRARNSDSACDLAAMAVFLGLNLSVS